MDNEISINWKGRQIDHNPRVFYEKYASEDIDDSLENEFLEMHQYIQEAYTEADHFVQEGSVLKTMGSKFVSAIKKIISAIGRVLRFIGRQIGKLFSINPKKDVNSVCRKLNMKSEGRLEMKNVYDSKDPLLKYTNVDGNNMSINVGNIFKGNKNSQRYPTTINTVVNQVIYRVNEGFSLTIPKYNLDTIVGLLPTAMSNKSTKEQPSAGYIEAAVVIAHMEHPEIIRNIGLAFHPALSALTSGAHIDARTCKHYLEQISNTMDSGTDTIQKHIKRIEGSDQIVRDDDVRRLQKEISKVSDMFIKFQDANFDIDEALSDYFKSALVRAAQNALGIVETIQMGLNAMVKAIHSPNKFISGQYIGCCDNLVLLDSFVKELINEGIPSAYVGLNTYLVASPKIRGSYDKKWEPKWGQSRLTLYPSDKSTVCYKIALNGMGTRSNNTEYSWYKSKSNLHDILVGIRDIGSNKCVLVADRLQENKSVSVSEVNTFLIKNQDRIVNNKMGDIHQNNVAYDMNNNIKIIDFGWVNMG
jgi:hypothetical protein